MGSEEQKCDGLGERFEGAVNQAARERGELAEKISRLVAEKSQFKKRIAELEGKADRSLELIILNPEDAHPEHALGLDFSLPEDRR